MKFLLAMVLVAACAHDEDRSAPTSDQLAPAATLTGTLPRKMRNCPSAVPGTTTRAVNTSAGVDLELTNDDPVALREIISRAELQSTQHGPRWFIPQHSGMHGGPGNIGRCPVIRANTDITYDPMERGVRIHILAREKAQTPELQQAVAARTHALAPQS